MTAGTSPHRYRSVLLDSEWEGILDLQLTPCAAAAAARGVGAPFASLDPGETELVVDGGHFSIERRALLHMA
jgi:hypothetical protein